MPYNYTHHRFGRDLLSLLPGPELQCVQQFRRMYDMGLHGPDFLFYHRPFWFHSRKAMGAWFHSRKGQAFFPGAWSAAGSGAARAYLLGLLAHYCLDSLCHPYIDDLAAEGKVRHIALESEWDRHLLARDGVASPHTYDMSRCFSLTREESVSVAAFYPGITPGVVRSGIRTMAFAARFFSRGNRRRRIRLLWRIKPWCCDFFLPTREQENLAPYIGELDARYRQALETYPRLLQELLEARGGPLSDAFAPIFG